MLTTQEYDTFNWPRTTRKTGRVAEDQMCCFTKAHWYPQKWFKVIVEKNRTVKNPGFEECLLDSKEGINSHMLPPHKKTLSPWILPEGEDYQVCLIAEILQKTLHSNSLVCSVNSIQDQKPLRISPQKHFAFALYYID